MTYIPVLITAIIGAVVAFLFARIEKKIDQMESENDTHHKEQVTMRTAERELMLAIADTTMLTAKKVNNRTSVNGELEQSIKELDKRKKRVQELTHEFYFEHVD